MKKILSALIVLVLGFSLCIFAYAEDVTADVVTTIVYETVADETYVDETAVDETTPDETAVDETTPDETVADETDPDETAEDISAVEDETVVLYDDDQTYDPGIAENVLYKGAESPQTGSAAGAMAVFGTLSAVAAAAFICAKKRA